MIERARDDMPTALIVEDEPAANQLLSMLVQLKGYRTESAFRGDEAMEKARVRHPDVVFLDLMLPDTDGYEVCKALSSHRATSDIPVVMVTARLADENRVQGFRAGAVEYVPKPYTPDQIFSAMSQADSWRCGLGSLAESGTIDVDCRDEVAHLRRASDLRSLLLARTRLDEEDVRRLVSTLLEVLQRGFGWGRSHGRELVATLAFRLEADAIVFELHDRAGWLSGGDLGRGDLSSLLAGGGFDRVDFRDDRDLVLSRSIPAG